MFWLFVNSQAWMWKRNFLFISCANWWRGLERGGGGDGVGVIGLLISSLLWNQIWSQITAAKSKNFGASSKEREEGTWI